MTGWGSAGPCSAGGAFGHSVGEAQHGGAEWGPLTPVNFF